MTPIPPYTPDAGGGGDDPVQAVDVAYDGSGSGLTDNVQGAIDDLAGQISGGGGAGGGTLKSVRQQFPLNVDHLDGAYTVVFTTTSNYFNDTDQPVKARIEVQAPKVQISITGDNDHTQFSRALSVTLGNQAGDINQQQWADAQGSQKFAGSPADDLVQGVSIGSLVAANDGNFIIQPGELIFLQINDAITQEGNPAPDFSTDGVFDEHGNGYVVTITLEAYVQQPIPAPLISDVVMAAPGTVSVIGTNLDGAASYRFTGDVTGGGVLDFTLHSPEGPTPYFNSPPISIIWFAGNVQAKAEPFTSLGATVTHVYAYDPLGNQLLGIDVNTVIDPV